MHFETLHITVCSTCDSSLTGGFSYSKSAIRLYSKPIQRVSRNLLGGVAFGKSRPGEGPKTRFPLVGQYLTTLSYPTGSWQLCNSFSATVMPVVSSPKQMASPEHKIAGIDLPFCSRYNIVTLASWFEWRLAQPSTVLFRNLVSLLNIRRFWWSDVWLSD